MKSLTLFFLCVCLMASTSKAALAPLPGTLLVTNQGEGVLRQYDATTGISVGSLQLQRPNGTTFENVFSIGYVNGSLVVKAVSLSDGGYYGTINPLTGVVTEIPLDPLNVGSAGTRGNQLLVQYATLVRSFNADFSFASDVSLQPVPGTYNNGDFVGIAWDALGSHYVTASNDSAWRDEVQYWNTNGTFAFRRMIQPINLFTVNRSIDMDPVNGDLWVLSSEGGGFTYIRKFGLGSSAPLWSTTVQLPGPVQDIVYIPVPAPTTLIPTLALALFAARRRR